MDFTLFLIFLTAAAGAGITGALFPTGDWYKGLKKPDWVPPNWVFPVVWISIYILISFAASRVANLPASGTALAFWALQMVFNTLWTPVFFGLRRLKSALVIMAVLWLAVLGATITHFQLDIWAGLAFLPYLIWVSIAAMLNLSVARLNPDEMPLDIHRL